MKISLFQSKRFVMTLTLTMCCVAFSVFILGLAIAFNKAPNNNSTSAQYIYGNNSITKLEVIDNITLEDDTIEKLQPKIQVTATGEQGRFGALVLVTQTHVMFEYILSGETHSFTAVGPNIDVTKPDEGGGGSVTISDIYKLGDFSNNVNIGNSVWSNAYVSLTCDIDDADGYLTMPIGTKTHPFKGTFDGKGHTISGYNMKPNILTNGSFVDSETIGGSNYYYAGLFGYVTGTIKNLKVTNATVSIATEGNIPWGGYSYYNFIHGPVSNGNYVRVQNQGCPPTSAVVYAGLLAGYCNKIEKCSIAGKLYCYIYTPGPNNLGWCSSSLLAGGVVGQAKEINNCESSAYVEVSALDGVGNVLVGGIAGTCTKTYKSLSTAQIWYNGVIYYSDVAYENANFCTATMVAIGGIIGGYRDGIESGGVTIESCVSMIDLQINDQHYSELSLKNGRYQHMNYIYSFNEIFGGGFNFSGLTWYSNSDSNPRYFYFDSSVFTFTNNYYHCYNGGYFSRTKDNQVNTKCGEYSTKL